MAHRMTNDEYRFYWAMRIGGRYMGTDGADEYGRRNAVEGELLARVTLQKIMAHKNISDWLSAQYMVPHRPFLSVPRACRYAMISVMNEHQEDKGETRGLNVLANRLREAVSRPLDEWREVYESFSPVDLESGERRPRVPPPGTETRRAAVLVPIIVEGEDARVVYTVRTDDLADHAGQISFPGGSMEARDPSLLETALREAEEEIDLRPELVEVVGELEEMYIPPSNFRVSPFVGLLPPEAEMVLAPDEVEEIFTVPLKTLTANGTFRKVLWRREGRDYKVPVFAIEGPVPRNIWGATAAMTAALLARLGWREYRR